MKARRFRFRILTLFLSLLFILLGLYGAYSVQKYGNRWFSMTDNPRIAALKDSAVAGDVTDRNDVTLASTADGRRVYQDSVAARSSLVHLLGDRDGRVSYSIESFHTGYLYGYYSALRDALHRLVGKEELRKGNSIRLTVDAALCAEIPGYFSSHPETSGKEGAAVVVNYLTGEIIVSVSLPVFDPDASGGVPDRDTVNKVTQALRPVGGLRKIITSAAAFSADQTVSSALTDEDPRADAATETKTAEAFFFNRNFLLHDLVVYNSSYSADSPDSAVCTPLHMALVVSAVANRGNMPRAYLLSDVRAASGSKVYASSPATLSTACTPAVADHVSAMMKDAVQNGGDASSAAVAAMDIRGMTAFAPADSGDPAGCCWFAGFNALQDLPFAVCVLVDGPADAGDGNSPAALIARDIFTWLRNHPDLVR